MTEGKPTCGQLYKASLDSFCRGSPEKARLFAGGFVCGQAEKVYLGACRASMFRPSADRYEMLREIAREAADRYSLRLVLLPSGEIWLCREASDAQAVEALIGFEAGSRRWHEIRASLCGVPFMEIDAEYHRRPGHGERCD